MSVSIKLDGYIWSATLRFKLVLNQFCAALGQSNGSNFASGISTFTFRSNVDRDYWLVWSRTGVSSQDCCNRLWQQPQAVIDALVR